MDGTNEMKCCPLDVFPFGLIFWGLKHLLMRISSLLSCFTHLFTKLFDWITGFSYRMFLRTLFVILSYVEEGTTFLGRFLVRFLLQGRFFDGSLLL